MSEEGYSDLFERRTQVTEKDLCIQTQPILKTDTGAHKHRGKHLCWKLKGHLSKHLCHCGKEW